MTACHCPLHSLILACCFTTDGTELRGIYATNPSTARAICNGIGKDACDFPALIGNDDYYGGLGGEFVITTKSTTSGTIALRHELGHNFGYAHMCAEAV